MKAPFPYFGGKSKVAEEVWRRFGDVPNFVEPFAGSAAVLLARPDAHQWAERIETVNDADGMIANFWRAVQADPSEVARFADWPVNENDLHARHGWLVGQRERVTAMLEGDPEWYDAKVAGWWLWGINSWIGGGWCAGLGPWHQIDGLLVNTRDDGEGVWRQLPHLGAGRGIKRQLPHLRNAGQGINRKLPHLGAGRGINRKLPHLGAGQGINRKLPHLGAGRGINRKLPHLGSAGLCDEWSEHLAHMMADLADRLRRVRVASGDWQRVCGFSPTERLALTGVFLDPPYAHEGRDATIYTHEMVVADDVREWAIERGKSPLMRIALCGYQGEHDMPEGWAAYAWKAHGGYGSQGAEDGRGRANSEREVVWFSPACINPETQSQQSLWAVQP